MSQLFDFKGKELSKTEKAVEVMEQQLIGLQRQIAAVCMLLNVTPNDFAIKCQDNAAIIAFLTDTSKAQELILNAQKNVPLSTPDLPQTGQE